MANMFDSTVRDLRPGDVCQNGLDFDSSIVSPFSPALGALARVPAPIPCQSSPVGTNGVGSPRCIAFHRIQGG